MVDKSYMTREPPPPSRTKVAFDQTVVPVFIDAAGWLEVRLEQVLGSVRRAPVPSVLIAAGVGFLLAQARRRG